jgi:hypothetical protein
VNPRTWIPKASTLPLDHRSHFWVITQRVVVISYRRLGPETSLRNYHYWLRNNPEERSGHLLRCGSLKSQTCGSVFKERILFPDYKCWLLHKSSPGRHCMWGIEVRRLCRGNNGLWGRALRLCSGRHAKVTTHLYLVPKLRISGALPPLPHVCVCVCTYIYIYIYM